MILNGEQADEGSAAKTATVAAMVRALVFNVSAILPTAHPRESGDPVLSSSLNRTSYPFRPVESFRFPRRLPIFRILKIAQPNLVIQNAPFGIGLFDQLQLPEPVPLLDLALSSKRGFTGLMRLELDQKGDPIFGREAAKHLLPMLPDPRHHIVSRAGVERPITLTSDDIGEERHGLPYRSFLVIRRRC